MDLRPLSYDESRFSIRYRLQQYLLCRLTGRAFRHLTQ